MSHLSRLLSTTLTAAVLAAGCLTVATASPATAETCLPPIPPFPPVCFPTIPGTEPPTATTPTTITGTPAKVGVELTATEPTWSDPTATTTYQWQQSGVAIPDATQQTYTVRPADVGKQLSVVATGTTPLQQAGQSTSDPVTGMLGDAIEPTSPPSITGTPAVGQTLTAKPGTWDGDPEPTFGYRWYRNGVVISGATKSTYAVSGADAGRSLAVVVTATRPGYRPGSAAAGPKQVAKVTTTTKLVLVKKTIAKGAKGQVRITLTARGLTPSGTVRVFDGTKLVATYTVRPSDNGVRVVTLPVLKPGQHSLSARYAGDPTAKASQSTAVVLKVKSR